MAIPGVSLFTLANLDQVELNLYIPETQIARVKVGQRVVVSVDSFPNRAFEGRVTHIASQAEFTSSTVQTKEERTKTVFAVKVAIANPDHALKPGMPADAVIQEAQ
jgi:multidrug resistance efflux pump